MSANVPAVRNGSTELATVNQWSREQIDLLKRTVCKDSTDDEFSLFVAQCKRTGLDPFARQIHAVKRWDAKSGREVMTIQTGIDGFRLIADRTEKYAPGREPSFALDKDGELCSATAYVKKFVGGTWHEIAATAFWDEAVQTKKDGSPNSFWARMPRLMLAKVAEALALRRAFPQELSGVYTDDEIAVEETPPQPQISAQDAATILQLIDQTRSDAAKFCAHFHVQDVDDLTPTQAKQAIAMLRKKADARVKALPPPVETLNPDTLPVKSLDEIKQLVEPAKPSRKGMASKKEVDAIRISATALGMDESRLSDWLRDNFGPDVQVPQDLTAEQAHEALRHLAEQIGERKAIQAEDVT